MIITFASRYKKMIISFIGNSISVKEQYLKGTVRRKLRWVKSGINRKLFLYCLAADIFNFDLKGQYSLNSIKPVSAFNDHKISFVESM